MCNTTKFKIHHTVRFRTLRKRTHYTKKSIKPSVTEFTDGRESQ